MKYHGRELGATLVAIACAQAQAAPSQCSGTQHVDAVTRVYLPTGFVQAQSRMVQTDGHVTQLRRYQAQGQSQPRLGGVHFSTLANAGGCTIGFIRLTPSLATREPLTQEEALTWAALGALGVLATVESLWPADYPAYPSSGHYAPENGRFFNTPPLQAVIDRKGQRAALWAMFFHGDRFVPPTALPFRQADWALFLAPAETARFIWLGHSSLLARLNGQTVLIDPVFASRVSPIPGLGRRFAPLPVVLQALPEIDVVLYSHNHYDHLDEQVVRHLLKRSTRFIVPLGMGALLQEMGVPQARIRELDWWQSHTLEGVRYHAVPARHSSGRLRYGDTDRTLWAGWVLQTAGESFYFSGDTSFGPHFAEIGRRWGGFDIAFIENGQYNRIWADHHLMPAQSVQAALEARAMRFMPVHWGAYVLAVHAWDEPVEQSLLLARQAGLDMLTPLLGQVFDKHTVTVPWWQNLNNLQGAL